MEQQEQEQQPSPQKFPKEFDPYTFTHTALVKDISQKTDITQFFTSTEHLEYENIINLCVKARIVGIQVVLFPLSMEVVTALNQKGFDTKMGQKCHSCQGEEAKKEYDATNVSSKSWSFFSSSSEKLQCDHKCGQFTNIIIPLYTAEKKEEKK